LFPVAKGALCKSGENKGFKLGFWLHVLYFTAVSTTGSMNTAGCTTGWVNYANEPSQAALERSSQDAYDVITLTHSKAAVWTVVEFLKRAFISLFIYFYPR